MKTHIWLLAAATCLTLSLCASAQITSSTQSVVLVHADGTRTLFTGNSLDRAYAAAVSTDRRVEISASSGHPFSLVAPLDTTLGCIASIPLVGIGPVLPTILSSVNGKGTYLVRLSDGSGNFNLVATVYGPAYAYPTQQCAFSVGEVHDIAILGTTDAIYSRTMCGRWTFDRMVAQSQWDALAIFDPCGQYVVNDSTLIAKGPWPWLRSATHCANVGDVDSQGTTSVRFHNTTCNASGGTGANGGYLVSFGSTINLDDDSITTSGPNALDLTNFIPNPGTLTVTSRTKYDHNKTQGFITQQ